MSNPTVGTVAVPAEVVTDDKIDCMIEAEAEHAREVERLEGLRAELDALKGTTQKEAK